MRGRLAEIIVLDQFARNIYRNCPQAFAQDGMAVVLAQEAVTQPDFAALPAVERRFVLMPFMHSESVRIHEQALPLFAALDDAVVWDYELRHLEIIPTPKNKVSLTYESREASTK